MATRFRDSSAKFSGSSKEVWSEFVSEYQSMSRDYNLSANQRFQFLHNILSGDAKRYYLNTIQGHARDYTEAVAMIESEYNPPVRQMQVKNLLSTHRMSALVAAGQTQGAALAATYRLIMKMSPQVPISHRSDHHKVDWLRCAVVGYHWATEPLSRVATLGLTFQQLYGELESSLKPHTEAAEAAVRDGAIRQRAVSTAVPRIMKADMMYQGQGMYARPNKGVGATRPGGGGGISGGGGRAATPGSFDPLTVAGCFNCDNPGHTMRDCKNPINATKEAQL